MLANDATMMPAKLKVTNDQSTMAWKSYGSIALPTQKDENMTPLRVGAKAEGVWISAD
jgi:hypothetical protein